MSLNLENGSSQHENIVALPEQEMGIVCRVVKLEDRSAIHLLYECRLDPLRMNLLCAKFSTLVENAEREVRALGDKDVARIVAALRDTAKVDGAP